MTFLPGLLPILPGISPILSPGNYTSTLLYIINREILVNSTFFTPGRNFVLPSKVTSWANGDISSSQIVYIPGHSSIWRQSYSHSHWEKERYCLSLGRHSSQKKKGQILAQQPLSNHVAKVEVKIWNIQIWKKSEHQCLNTFVAYVSLPNVKLPF